MHETKIYKSNPHLPRTGVGWKAPREDWFLDADEGPSIDCWKCIQRCIWMFPKIVVPPKHPKMIIFSRKIHGFVGYHYFWKHPYPKEWYICNCSAQLAACIMSSFLKKTLKFRTTKHTHFRKQFRLAKTQWDLAFLPSHENLCWLQRWDSIKTEAFGIPFGKPHRTISFRFLAAA